MQQVKLWNGREMPSVGLGTYARKAESGQFRQAVEHGIDAGYRHIDTASCYMNEEEVGEAINNKIQGGVVTRGELFVTTKENIVMLGWSADGMVLHAGMILRYWAGPPLGGTWSELWAADGCRRQAATQSGALWERPMFSSVHFQADDHLWNDCHAKEDVIPALNKSLARLKLDYVDLYLIHWPVSVNANGEDTDIDFIETWKGMEQALHEGLAKSIGVSNFNQEQLQRLLQNCNIKPVCNQVEINPTLTQHKLVEYCKQHSIIPVAYTPLGLISEARPEFIGKDIIKTDPQLGVVAAKHGKTRAQVALRYLVQRGIPVLPKSFTKSRIEENLNIFDFELTEEDMKVVESYNIDHRCVPGTSLRHLKYYPF